MPKEKTQGSRRKPPQWPPTAVGTLPPAGFTPSKTRRIISFLSAHRGVGKSTLAFYSAVAWANWASCSVIYVCFEFAAGEHYRRRLGIGEESVWHSGAETTIGLADCGVGILMLARDSSETASWNRPALINYLTRLNRVYDLFFDIDPDSLETDSGDAETLGRALLRESDHAFWVTNPRNSLYRKDLKALRRLHAVDGAAGKIDLAANRIGAPGMAEYGSLKRLLRELNTKQIFAVPELRDLDSWRVDRAADDPRFKEAFLPLLEKVESTGRARSESRRTPLNSEEDIALALSKKSGAPYASRENQILKMEKGQNLEKIIPEAFARREFILPLFMDGNVLAVAISDPENLSLLDDLKERTGREIQPFISTKSQIIRAIDVFYRGGVPSDEMNAGRSERLRRESEGGGAQAIGLVNEMLKQSLHENATDIHIERFEDHVSLRFRVNDALVERVPFPRGVFGGVVERIKILANLNVSERVRPQEGGFSIKVKERVIQFQVSTIGTTTGESVVLHRIDKKD